MFKILFILHWFMFCNVLLPSSSPLSIFWLLPMINNFKSNSREVKSTILCRFKSWNRNVSVYLTTDVLLKSDWNILQDVLQHCTTAVLKHQRAGPHLKTVWYRPDLLLQPIEWDVGVVTLFVWANALRGGRESHRNRLDIITFRGFWVSTWFFWPTKMDVCKSSMELRTHPCVFTLSDVHSAPESTL